LSQVIHSLSSRRFGCHGASTTLTGALQVTPSGDRLTTTAAASPGESASDAISQTPWRAS
jgi:hypothetical protein